MDHKKVDEDNPGIVPLNEDDEPYIFEEDGITPIEFDAEFNDAIFRGDLTGCKGEFSGTLSAGMVNAVDRINFLSGSIIRSMMVFDNSVTTLVRDNTWKEMISGVFVVPPEDASAVVHVKACFVGYSATENGSGVYSGSIMGGYKMEVKLAGVLVGKVEYYAGCVDIWQLQRIGYTYTSYGGYLGGYYQYFSKIMRAFFTLSPGTYTITVYYKCAPGSISGWDPRNKSKIIQADYFRKY